MARDSIRGSCLCGGIRFEITGAPLWMSECHCSRCRKSGTRAHISILADQFRWLQGADLVARYEPEKPFAIVRCFCRVCGTPLGEPATNTKGFPIAVTALDDDPGVRTILHEHVADKPPWYEITDDAPQHSASPRSRPDE